MVSILCLISVSVGLNIEMVDNCKSSVVPWVDRIVFHVMEDCWFVVDNTDLSNAIDVNFKMVAITIVPVTVHSSTLDLLDSDDSFFVDRKSMAVIAIIWISIDS